MASVCKPSNSRYWWGRFMRDGKEHRMSLKTANKQVADKKLRKLVDKVDGNMAIEIDGGYTYDDLMLLFLYDYEIVRRRNGVAGSTIVRDLN